MYADLEFEDLEASLKRSGASWDAAQAHGLLTARLSVGAAASEWLAFLFEGVDPANALRKESENQLLQLFQQTALALEERQSAFAPLLPDDAAPADERAAALAGWCEGFLHGLVSGGHDEILKKRLAEEPIADIIKDMLQITRAGAGDDESGEQEEDAYAQLVEYLRVASQLVFEELAELREQASGGQPHNIH